MNKEILLLTKNNSIISEFKQISPRFKAKVHQMDVPCKINKSSTKRGKNIEVVFLDTTWPEEELNRFIFYIRQYKKDVPVVLFSAEHFPNKENESEAMRNLAVYGYIRKLNSNEEIEEILEDFNGLFELDMEKKFDKVEYMEDEKVFVCTFKDRKKYFLKRSDIGDDPKEKIKNITIDKNDYHFTIEFISGATSEVPWDYVKSISDVGNANSENVSSVEIGDRVRYQRALLNFTQEDLASKTGMQRSNIARIEAGKHCPSIETLERIAEALKKPVALFIAR